MTMIERVAAAILEKNWCNECYAEVNHCGCAMDMAKAAIEAMRELPEELKDTNVTTMKDGRQHVDGTPMQAALDFIIDAALKEEK